MNTALIRDFLLWCAVINYGVLLGWFAAFTLAHDAMYRLHHKWFAVSREQFDAIHYAGMAVYKVGVLLLNIAPYVALWIVDRRP